MEVECLIGFVLPTLEYCTLAVFSCCYFVFICPLAYAFYSVSPCILFRFSAHFIPSLRAFYSVSLRIWLAYFHSIVRSDLRWG